MTSIRGIPVSNWLLTPEISDLSRPILLDFCRQDRPFNSGYWGVVFVVLGFLKNINSRIFFSFCRLSFLRLFIWW